jgi:PAS domain S-box-containing protein
MTTKATAKAGTVLKAVFTPAIWAMNRMNFVAKFLFIGLLLLLPFAYVTHLMRQETKKQIVFNRKESYGVEYITPAFRLLGHLQSCRTHSAAIFAGNASSIDLLAREMAAVDALIPVIDRIDAKYREELRTGDGDFACARSWESIKAGWHDLKQRAWKSGEEAIEHHTALSTMVIDWILKDAANYSNLILDPDLDSYWLMDAFVYKLPRITEDLSEACARSLLRSGPGGRQTKEMLDEGRLQIHGLYINSLNTLNAFVSVNLETAYDCNRAAGRNLRSRIQEPAHKTIEATRQYLAMVKEQVVRWDSSPANPEQLISRCNDSLGAIHHLYGIIGPELDGLILARVQNYKRDLTRGMIAAESATFLHVYLFIAFYIAVHVSVSRVAGFTRRMIEGTSERFEIDSHDELGKVAEAFNQINGALNQTRTLKDQVERRGEELQASEERFRTLAGRAPVGIFLTDAQGNCLYVNERWCKMTSLTAEEVKEKDWIPAVHPDDRKRVVEEWKSTVAKGEDFSSEFRFGIDQNVVWVSGNAVVQRDRFGAVTGFLGSVTDISEQKRVERLKNEFISTVSHELRTPLTSIRGSLGLIAGGVAGELSVKARTMVDIAKKNCERLVRLVSDILDIEKIESGKMVFDIRTVEFAPLLEQAVEASRGFGQSLGINVELDNSHPGVRVQVDGDRLTQVVANLLSNACKFSPKGGVVRVRVGLQGENIRVSVDDQGTGIPDEFRSRIFQKFAQADGSDGRAKQGTGLGLSICKAIVERMGGRIGFESAVGQGTTFFFDLPAQVPAARPSGSHRPDRSSVLVCEDDPDIAMILRGILESAGHNVDVAVSAEQAKELLKRNTYVGMTLDLALPDQDGISLVRELREDPATRRLPIVIVSAYMEEGRKSINGDAFGILDWLEKPIDEARLKKALARATELFDGRKPRILHVEDDHDIFQVVQTALSDRAEVIQSGSLSDARARIRGEKFDLLILDIGLPDGSGLELLPVLRGTPHAATPVVVFSAQELSPRTARHVQATLLKSKTSNEELVSTISDILGNPVYNPARDLVKVGA